MTQTICKNCGHKIKENRKSHKFNHWQKSDRKEFSTFYDYSIRCGYCDCTNPEPKMEMNEHERMAQRNMLFGQGEDIENRKEVS